MDNESIIRIARLRFLLAMTAYFKERRNMETIPTTQKVIATSEKGSLKPVGISCEFKLPADKRTIQHASPDEAEAAGKWVIEKYSRALAELAK
ncbi:MAG: hypothetical protein ACAI35_23895 [Candidatus Methylacidiphilales bacterium]|nr:hypothetical protein [Candidatus Methylacidiphilales bacterium]